jgi:hypothetical protein
MTMKKNVVNYFVIFIFLSALTSCATDARLKSYIVGVWQPVKLGAVDIKKLLPRDDTLSHQYTAEDYKILLELKMSAGKKDASENSGADYFSILINEANTSYKFTKEGFGARSNPDQPIKGTWKLKKKGTRLILTGNETKEQFILLIDSLSPGKMVATNKNLPDGMKVTYVKGK